MTPQLRGGSLDRIFDMGAGLGVHHASFLAVPILVNVVASSEAPTAQSMLLARATASTGQDRGEMPPYLLKGGTGEEKVPAKTLAKTFGSRACHNRGQNLPPTREERPRTMATEPSALELKMDPATLYREDSFTDRRMGLIRVLTPVKSDGLTDASRKVVYIGEAQLLTAAGPLPLSFEIEEMRREAASSIVIPGRDPLGFGKSGPMPGGGKLQFP